MEQNRRPKWAHVTLVIWYLTKMLKTYNGEKTASLISPKIACPHIEEWNQICTYHYEQKLTTNGSNI